LAGGVAAHPAEAGGVAGVARGGGAGRAAAAAGAGADTAGRWTEYSNQMAQKIRLSTIAKPRTVPKGNVSTGFTVMAPESGEMMSAADSGLGASAVTPPAAGLAWLVGAAEAAADGLAAGADGAAVALVVGLGAAAGLAGALAAGDGTTTATGGGDGEGGCTEGTGAGVKDSWPAVPRRWNWKTLAAIKAPIAMTRNNAGNRKRRVSLCRITGHFSGIAPGHGTNVRAENRGPQARSPGAASGRTRRANPIPIAKTPGPG
jgi:hypothetical protein